MSNRRSNPDFLNGVPELLILQLLSTRAMYGYQIVQAIRLSTKGRLEFGEGCVYPILHRLEADGYITGQRETVAGRNRVVYRVTASGARRLQDQVSAWQMVVGAVENVLQGATHVEPGLA
ncbi:MAG: PadR family transcriptional regulator [Planctomycetes bacterium]|nr:PadR family transcriptional regulator [Planctomycetota bacterium]